MSSRRLMRRSRKVALTTFVATTATIASTAAVTGLPSASDAAVLPAGTHASPAAARHGEDHAKRDTFGNFDTRTEQSRAVWRAGAQLLAIRRGSHPRLRRGARRAGEPVDRRAHRHTVQRQQARRLPDRPELSKAGRRRARLRAQQPRRPRPHGRRPRHPRTCASRSPTSTASRHLSWTQRSTATQVFGNGLRAHVARDGSLISLQGAPIAGLADLAAAAPERSSPPPTLARTRSATSTARPRLRPAPSTERPRAGPTATTRSGSTS